MPELMKGMASCSGVAAFVFHDGANVAVCSRKDDAAVAGGIVEARGDQRSGGVAGGLAADQFGQSGGRKQRAVAIEHNYQSRLWKPASRGRPAAHGRCLFARFDRRSGRPKAPAAPGLDRPDVPPRRWRCSAGAMAPEAATTCSISDRPPARCSTLARLDFMRVPRPAARITTLICDVILAVWFRPVRLTLSRERGLLRASRSSALCQL